MRLSQIILLASTTLADVLQLESPIQEDGTIRLPGFPNMCVYKRWNDYKLAQDVFSWPCDDINSVNPVKQGRLKWAYNSTTGLVKSVGSEEMRPNKPFCWNMVTAGRQSQKLKIKACDENDVNQQFDFDLNGRFVPREDRTVCVGYDMKVSDGSVQSKALKLNKCWGVNFMRIHQVVSEVPEEPTTLEPTTPEPTTLAPTTLAPTTLAPTTLPPTTASNLKLCGEINTYNPDSQQCCNTTIGYNYLLPLLHPCNETLYQNCGENVYNPNLMECCTFGNQSRLLQPGVCNNCEIGFHFSPETFTCEENVCTCDNGLMSRSRHCDDPQMNPEHDLYDPEYTIRCCYEHNANSCQRCSNGFHNRYDWVVCLANKCNCANGDAEDRTGNNFWCPVDGFDLCKTCDRGYEMVSVFDEEVGFNSTTCEPIVCRCDFGVPSDSCVDLNSNSCLSCDDGFELQGTTCVDMSNQYMPSPQQELLATTLLQRFMENEQTRRYGLSIHEALHATPKPHIVRLSFHANTGLSDGCVDFNKTGFNKGLEQIYYRVHNWYDLYEATFNFFKNMNNSVISNGPYNVTETLILENQIDRDSNFRSYRHLCIEGENPDRYLEKSIYHCYDSSRTFHAHALHDEFIRVTGIQNNDTLYTDSDEFDADELWNDYLFKFYYNVYNNNTHWDDSEPLITRADFFNILYTEAYHDMSPNPFQQQCQSGKRRGVHQYSDTPDPEGGPVNAKWYKGCYQDDYENGLRGDNWPSTGIFGNDTKPTLQPTNLRVTEASGGTNRQTKFYVGATHGPIIHVTRNYGRIDAVDRGNCPIEMYSDDEVTYTQSEHTPAAERLFSTNAPIMERLFPGMKSWEFGALMGAHSVGAVHKNISGFTTGQWVSCGNKKITNRFFGRFASQGYAAQQCTDCNEMGHGEFHTVEGRVCGSGADAYERWQGEYLAGRKVEAILPKRCPSPTNDVNLNASTEGLTGLDRFKARLDYENCPDCQVADMTCGIDKPGARGAAIIGLILDITQFRKDLVEENGVLYKSKGDYHINGDNKFHPAGEKVVWARDQPTNYDESWTYKDDSRWANYFVPHDTSSLIDPNPSRWRNNTDWDVDFYFDFTRSAQKMMNNGYLGDFGAHKRRHGLWDAKVQEDTWRQMCMDMWAPVWGRQDNVPKWKTNFAEQEVYCRQYPDYYPMEGGYDLGVEPEIDPDGGSD